MILNYDKRPEATVDQKVQSLMESTQLALNDISRAQETADVAKEDAQTSVALAETARTAANEASDSARIAKQAADEATAAVEEIEGDVSGLTTRVAQAETDIDAAEGSIVALGTRVGTAETNITNIEGNVTSLAGRVSDAEDDINAVEGDITSLQSDVSTAQGNITTIQGNLTSLTGRVSAAEGDITTVEGDITSLQGRVSDAEDDVEDVMKGLSLAENVVGTLNWITAHSTVTTDTTPQAGTTYYIKHLDGTYEIVTDTTGKNPAQEGWYVLDEALQNYVLSHLALTNDGLYVMKDGSQWKVKVADDGVYILDPNNKPANQMTGNGNIIGYEDETHAEIDYHSLKLIDKEGNTFFHVSDLRDTSGKAEIVETLYGNGVTVRFDLSFPATGPDYSVTVNGVEATNVTKEDTHVKFTTAPSAGDVIVFTYDTASDKAKAFTFGKRRSGSIGPLSIAFGQDVLASGYNSHAEGYYTTASGAGAHAEGNHTTASGKYSHVEGGPYTTASGAYSHAEGSNTEASGGSSHTEGGYTTASGDFSHAEGYYTTASGEDAHAEGGHTTASGAYSHAEGNHTTASGAYSHAEGNHTTASGAYSHAQNKGTTVEYEAQTAIGKYNENKEENALEIGNGTSGSDRSNAYAVDWNGNIITKDLELTRGTPPALSNYRKKITFTDSNDTELGCICTPFLTDGREGIQLETTRTVNGSEIYNGIQMYINASGTPSVTLNHPKAWRTALGLEPFTPSISITSTTGTLNKYVIRQMGKLVSLTLYVYNTNSVASAQNIYQGTINTEALRPIANTSTATFMGSRLFGGMINSAGTITLRNTSTSAVTTSSSNMATISFVYFVE